MLVKKNGTPQKTLKKIKNKTILVTFIRTTACWYVKSILNGWRVTINPNTGIVAVIVVKYEAELLILIYIVSKKYFKASKMGLRKKKKVKTWMLSPRKSRSLQNRACFYLSDILLLGFWIAPTNVWKSFTLNWLSVPFMIHFVSMHLTSKLLYCKK